jgi:hypothetical protein
MIGQPLLRRVSEVAEIPVGSIREHRDDTTGTTAIVQAIYLKAASALAQGASVTVNAATGTATSGGSDAKAAADIAANSYGWFVFPLPKPAA